MSHSISKKTFLITGGTGSFGIAVLDRLLKLDVGEIRIFSRDEAKQDLLRQQVNNNKVKFYIGDVRDSASINDAVKGVDYVFHAAALKQVPSCEFFPLQAVQTNILGTSNVLEAAIRAKVKRVVVLSTDKAVYPINAMGMSKALMEKVVFAKARGLSSNETILCVTRYGNVMASRGSVIPLFIKQIKSGQAITITDPKMTRFMMTLDDAVDLVLFAFSNASQGELFVQKAPAATVKNIVDALKELYQSDVNEVFIGTRHGEKKFETLINREEMVHAVDLGDYYKIEPDNRDLNYGQYLSEGEERINLAADYNSDNTVLLQGDALKDLLCKLELIRKDIGVDF